MYLVIPQTYKVTTVDAENAVTVHSVNSRWNQPIDMLLLKGGIHCFVKYVIISQLTDS
jgi:hypothetical protein